MLGKARKSKSPKVVPVWKLNSLTKLLLGRFPVRQNFSLNLLPAQCPVALQGTGRSLAVCEG